MDTLRKPDTKAEKALGEFLDKYFYSKLIWESDDNSDNKPYPYERVTDKEEQEKGIDVYLGTGTGLLKIDEKAAFYYSNTTMSTFAFELSFISQSKYLPNNTRLTGWFLIPELETTHYLLVWPTVVCIKDERTKKWVRKDVKDLKKDDFILLEMMLINKKRLQDWLSTDYALTPDILTEYNNRFLAKIQKNKDLTTDKSAPFSNDIYLSHSPHLSERPVNLVIKKHLLKELASCIIFVSSTDYALKKQKI